MASRIRRREDELAAGGRRCGVVGAFGELHRHRNGASHRDRNGRGRRHDPPPPGGTTFGGGGVQEAIEQLRRRSRFGAHDVSDVDAAEQPRQSGELGNLVAAGRAQLEVRLDIGALSRVERANDVRTE